MCVRLGLHSERINLPATTGQVELLQIISDLNLKKEIVAKKTFLKPLYEKSYDGMAVLRLKGKATVWSMQNMAAPTTFIDL